jgi:hypothetical protein
LPFVKWHCLHFGFDQSHSAAFSLAFFIQHVFFCIKVDKVGFCSWFSFPLVSRAIFGIVSFFTVGEAIECSSLAGIGYIGSSSPLASRVSSSSCPPVISRSCPSQVYQYGGIAHWWWGVWWVISLLRVSWGGMVIVIWSLVLEWYEGSVLSWGSFCC